MRLFGWGRDKKRLETTRRLAEGDDVRAVGPLAEALFDGDKAVREIAERGLIRLLPRLKESDAHVLNEEQNRRLRRALDGSNEDLAIAVLRALEFVGDSNALWDVLKLRSRTRAERVRDAAKECLPYLEARVPQDSLLRSSEAPSVPADALIRSEHHED